MEINLIGKNFDINSGQGIYKYSGELLNLLKRKKYEVRINQNGVINHVQQPELIWGSLFKKNLVTTIHDIIPLVYGERKFLFRIFFYFSCLLSCIKSKRVIVVSESTKKDVIRWFPFVKHKIKVIYEGIDSHKFYSDKKSIHKKFIIGYIGGLGKRKNIEFILRLAKEFQNNKKVLFKIAGKGPELDRLLKLKEKMRLNNVNFVGFIPEEKLNKFYNSLDIFIFPSLYEGFGLPVLEAMACGIPTIVSNNSSLPEIVRDSGILINSKDTQRLSKIIINLIKNKKRLKEFSKKAIKISKEFNWNKTMDGTIKVYEEVLK